MMKETFSTLVLFASAIVTTLSQELIASGEAKPNQFPYAVSIRMITTETHFASGAIISTTYILSSYEALKSVKIEEIVALAGCTDVRKLTCTDENQNYQQIFFEIMFSPSNSPTDIAILKTKFDIQFSLSVNKIALPDSEFLFGPVNLTGWGAPATTDKMKYSTFYSVGSLKCDVEVCYHCFCAPFPPPTGCYGDVGAGLISDGTALEAVDTVVGIEIRQCVREPLPHAPVFIRVYYFIEYIREITGM